MYTYITCVLTARWFAYVRQTFLKFFLRFQLFMQINLIGKTRARELWQTKVLMVFFFASPCSPFLRICYIRSFNGINSS